MYLKEFVCTIATSVNQTFGHLFQDPVYNTISSVLVRFLDAYDCDDVQGELAVYAVSP